MKNKQIIVLCLILIISMLLVIYSTIYMINEIKSNSDKQAAEYNVMSEDEIEILSDNSRLQIISKYTLVNNDEFSMTKLYELLSKACLSKFTTFQLFNQYIEKTIINNIDMTNDYMIAEKGVQTETDNYIETEYVINVYTSKEYIKLFSTENSEEPKSKFSYKVKLIESKVENNYCFEI